MRGEGALYKWVAKGADLALSNPWFIRDGNNGMHFNWRKVAGKNYDAGRFTALTDTEARSVSAAIGYAGMQAVAAASAGMTAGASHLYNGKQVTSSKRAKEMGGAVGSVLAAAIPWVGSALGSIAGQAISGIIDAGRDAANLQTETAQK